MVSDVLNKALSLASKYKKELMIGAGAIMLFLVVKNLVAKNYGGSNYDPNTNNLTITDQEAAIIADNLLMAMDRAGTDTDTIFRMLEGLGKDDILLVTKKFGEPPYGLYAKCSGTLGDIFCYKKNLFGWLKEELNKKQEERLRDIFDQVGLTF